MSDLLRLRYPTRGARKAVERQAKRLPNGFRKALDAITAEYKQALIDASPEGESGKLKREWSVRKEGRGGTARNTIYNRSRHFDYVTKGTKAHVIRPKHRIKKGPRKGQLGYLKFAGHAGQDVFAREVHHPGTRANPFHRTAARAARRRTGGMLHAGVVSVMHD